LGEREHKRIELVWREAVLSDVLGPTLSIVCEPCGRHETYDVARLMERHGDAKMTDLLQALANCPKARSANYPRSVQRGIRKAGLIVQLDEERLGLRRILALPRGVTSSSTRAWTLGFLAKRPRPRIDIEDGIADAVQGPRSSRA
jgi:hypothetical protein